MQLLADLLPERVASPLSLNALREDLEVSHRALTHWMDVLERLYHVFRIRPFATRSVRSLRKMPKAYLWDWSLVPDVGDRFEKLVAAHLLKLCHFLQDREGLAVEAKLRDTSLDPALVYFRDRLKVPRAYQVVLESERDFVQDGVRCLPAAKFLACLV